jgi:hypothetical protein
MKRAVLALLLGGVVVLWASARYLQFADCGISLGTALRLREKGFAREGSLVLVSFYSTAGFDGEADGQQQWGAIFEVLRHSLGGIVVDSGSDVSALGFVLSLGHEVHAMEPEADHRELLLQLACANKVAPKLKLHAIVPSNVTAVHDGRHYDRIDRLITHETRNFVNQFVRLLLLDRTGNEARVLDGAMGLLHTRQIEYIIMHLDPCARKNTDQLLSMLRLGYDAFGLSLPRRAGIAAKLSSVVQCVHSPSELVRKIEMGHLQRAALRAQALSSESAQRLIDVLTEWCESAAILLHKRPNFKPASR